MYKYKLIRQSHALINNDRESFQKKTNLIICWNIKQVDIIGRTPA